MTRHAAIALDFDEGIDRKTLRRLRDRFLAVNRERWARAHSALTYRQQTVLELLPLAFHLNHPALPGYQDVACPFGLSQYQPAPETLNAARRLARTFAVRDQGARVPDIHALFLMGSPGTLGHSVASDLDVWLCHRPDLPEDGARQLERKAERLSAWAREFGVELHVFVFSADDWRAGRQRVEVTGENCGSAQHFLLLDEFYRTGIHLAGRVPLWWLVPAEDEHRYDDCIRRLVDYRFVRADDYIDFGPVPSVPREEFLGAGVWQLYKGIDAPWKAILKLLLIECYARRPEWPLLSLSFKQRVFGGELDADALDPYRMLYERLERFLDGDHATDRLALARRSLYLKSGLPLSRLEGDRTEDWRARLLSGLVRSWGWTGAELAWLDDRRSWRAEDVVSLRRLVVAELTHSYRLLSRMAREAGQQAAITEQDMNLLGRKLYAVFQRKAGKIEQINPGLAPSLEEENLSFHHQAEQGVAGDGWLLYRDLEDPSDAFWKPVIRRSGNLSELVLWAYFNGLLTRATRLNVRAGPGSASVTELREMLAALTGFLPLPVRPATREALSRGVRPLRHLLMVNVGVDPQAHLTDRGLHRLSARHDSLGFSGLRENLVLSIDQVTLNSWREVSIQHYAAGDTVIQCLNHILASTAWSGGRVPEVHLFSVSRGHGNAIARRLQTLFDDLLGRFFAGDNGPHPLRYVIEMERRYFLLQFQHREPGVQSFNDKPALLAALAAPQDDYRPVVFDRHALEEEPMLRAVCEATGSGSVQVFFRPGPDRCDLWVVDEQGSVLTLGPVAQAPRYVLLPLLRFLDNLLERRLLRQPDIGRAAGEVAFAELVNQDGRWVAQPRRTPDAGLPLPGLEVQAVGVRLPDDRMAFNLYCGDQEFTVEEYGERVIPAVAHYLGSRRGGESYPVYLTDLHLPHDLDAGLYQPDIQTCQYLQYRQQIEKALTDHLPAP